MKRYLLFLVFVLVGSFLSSGCAWSRTKINDNDIFLRAKRIQPRVTKANDLPSILGQPPNNIIALNNGGQICAYNAGDSKTKAFNILILSISKTNIRTDSVYLFVNSAGVVDSVTIGTPKDIPWEWWAFDD